MTNALFFKLKLTSLSLLTFLAFSSTGYTSQLVEVQIGAAKDNTLYESSTGALSNGAGDYLFVGRTSQPPGTSIRRGLIYFDIAAHIPAGSIILSAEVQIFLSNNASGPSNVELHRVTTDWGEGASDAPGSEGSGAPAQTDDATWIHSFYSAQLWTTPGGDFDTTTSSSVTLDSIGFYTIPSTPVLVSDLQNWVNGTSINFGWILLGDETVFGTAKRLDSRQNPITANRPVLKVEYATPIEVNIGATKDNTLYESVTGSLSNGLGQHFFAGKTGFLDNFKIRRGLIAFNIAGNIPAGSSIQSVVLTLSMNRTSFLAGDQTVSLHKLTADWGEGTSDALFNEGMGAPATTNDATWLHRFYNSILWTTAGGDFNSSASASTTVGGIAFYNFGSSSQMIADVQDWLDNSGNNFGWIVIGNESDSITTKRFSSKQDTSETSWPSLAVTYLPPPCCIGLRGDFNDDGDNATVLDLTYLIDDIFSCGPASACP
ncbi:MAG: DNRLRE domain-containing protein, partial [candidate division Zixibacteria bacterium]|nr:DNRLRE domain-containing protein [candidate division Zixibacteria bacterium]